MRISFLKKIKSKILQLVHNKDNNNDDVLVAEKNAGLVFHPRVAIGTTIWYAKKVTDGDFIPTKGVISDIKNNLFYLTNGVNVENVYLSYEKCLNKCYKLEQDDLLSQL